VLWAEHVARNTAGARDDVFAEIAEQFTPAEIVELTAVCGLFAQSNRFQDSLAMPIEASHDVDKIRTSVRVDPGRVKAYIERLLADWPDEVVGAETTSPSRPAVTLTAPSAVRTQAAIASAVSARIPLLDQGSAGADGAWFLDVAEQLFGAIANSVRMWAHLPHLGKLVLPLQAALFHDGVLPMSTKCMALLRTSAANAAAYSLAHGLAMGRCAGLTEAQLRALSVPGEIDATEFDARDRAAIRWAERIATNTAKTDESAFANVRAHFTDAEIVELTGGCALANNFDRLHNALRIPVDSEQVVAALNQRARIESTALQRYLAAVLQCWPAALPSPKH